MKREIKFRAWDKRIKRMFPVYGYGRDFVTEDTIDGVDPGINCFHDDEFFERIEVTQYTGLKDKNGKEIYEGDVLKYEFEYPRYKPTTHKKVVKWNELSGGFDIEWINDFGAEIIGNIYENPELLEQ